MRTISRAWVLVRINDDDGGRLETTDDGLISMSGGDTTTDDARVWIRDSLGTRRTIEARVAHSFGLTAVQTRA